MDWNWFFSAVSQSTAAIVGIFAAFVITKIVNNKQKFDDKSIAISEHLNDSAKLKGQLGSRYFDWYNERTRDRDDLQLESEVRDLFFKHKKSDPGFYYAELNLSVFEDQKPVLKLISEVISYWQEELEKEPKPRTRQERKSPAGHDFAPDPSLFVRRDPELARIRAENRREVEREREIIDGILLQVDYQSNKNQILLNQVSGNPESSRLVNFSIVSILILFYVGVIYPLSFLPLDANLPPRLSIGSFFDILLSLRGVLLSAISIVFNVIVAVFFITNLKLKYDQESKENLRKLTEPRNYSEYIVRKEENLELLAKH